MTKLRPGLGSCTAELGHSRRPHFRDRLLRLDLIVSLRHRSDPTNVGLAPRPVTEASTIEPEGVHPRLLQHRLGQRRQRLLRPDDRVQTN